MKQYKHTENISSRNNMKYINSKIIIIGLIERKYQTTKLHLTLMNTKFKLTKEERNGKNFITFDATEIMKVNTFLIILLN